MRPFSNGTQFMDWQEANCQRCKKRTPEEHWPTCGIEAALYEAYMSDGQITDEMAVRMGINDETKDRYNWPCGEVQWTEEWKAEWTRRQAEKIKQG